MPFVIIFPLLVIMCFPIRRSLFKFVRIEVSVCEGLPPGGDATSNRNVMEYPKMKRRILFLAFLVPLLSACSSKETQQPAGEYKLLTVARSNTTLHTDYPATLRGRQTVEIRPQVSGLITEIRTDEGATVRKGQVLFVIDQVPYRAALETARANVRSAEAGLQTARLTTGSKEALFNKQVVSAFDLATARNQQLEAEAALAQAQAQETNARNNLSYTEVRSPVDGTTGMIPYRIGALVDSNIEEPLVVVSDDAQIFAYFSMAENQMLDLIQQYGSLGEAREKMPDVTLRMGNGATYDLAGRIDAISGTVDEGTGAVRLRAVFPNPRHLLRSGGSASVIVPTRYEACIVIPQTATYELQNRIFVWKVVDGATRSAPITVCKYNDGRNYIVESGLEVGDVIVAEGAGLLHEGIRIETAAPAAGTTRADSVASAGKPTAEPVK